MGLKEQLFNMLERGYELEAGFVESLPPEARSAAGAADAWAAKDEVMHMAIWKGRRAQNLAAWKRGEPQVVYQDYNQVNAEDFERNRDLPWEAVIESSQRAHARLVESLDDLAEEDLRVTPDEGGRTLWQGIVGVGYTHVVMHVTDYLFRHGETERASGVWEEATALLGGLDDSDEWQGTCRYNLACSHARSGRAELAVQALRQALQLNPDLTEWSKQDSDLDSLREREDYQAIYAA